MSVGKAGYIAPIVLPSTTTIAPVATTVAPTVTTVATGAGTSVATSGALLTGGALIVGGLVVGGVSYGYLAIKRDKLKSYLADGIKEIEKRERELKSRYNITLNYANQLKKISKEIMPKYDKSILEILSSEKQDREKFQNSLLTIRERLNLLKVEYKEIDKELEIYQTIIEQLEQPKSLDKPFQKILKLHKSIANSADIKTKKSLLNSLKEEIESYKDRVFEQYIIAHRLDDIKEEKIVEQHKSDKIRQEIEINLEKLTALKPNYQFPFDIEKESDRLELIRDNLKIEYAQAKKEKSFKDKLSELSSGIDNPDLNSKVALFIEKECFNLDEYEQLKQEIEAYQTQEQHKAENELIADEVIRNLKELGYTIVDEEKKRLKESKTVYIDIDNGYKLKVNFKSDNSFKIKFIRYVSSGYTPTSYDKQKDEEMVSKWSSDYDKLIALLAQNGLAIEHKIRLEPNGEDVEYVVEAEEEQLREKSISKGIERAN